MTTKLWKIHPEEDSAAKEVTGVDGNKPVLIYIGGDGDLKEKCPDIRTNRFLYSLLDPSSIADPMPGSAQKLSEAPKADVYAVTESDEKGTDLASAILPKVPDTLQELKQQLSRFTFLTFSRGAHYTNGAFGNLHVNLATKIYRSEKFKEEDISDALKCLGAIQLAPDNLTGDFPNYGEAGNQNVIPTIATAMAEDTLLKEGFRRENNFPYSLPEDGSPIGYNYDSKLNRAVILGRKPVVGSSDTYVSFVGKDRALATKTERTSDHHHVYLETNTTGGLGVKGLVTHQVSPYAHIVKHALQQMLHESEQSIKTSQPRNSAKIVADVKEHMLSESAIQAIPGYVEDGLKLHQIHSDLSTRGR